MNTYSIHLAESESDIRRCHPVMVQLRPQLAADEFVARVGRQRAEGYEVAYLESESQVRAVAGFRIVEMLMHGRHLYVDDLVTDAAQRSKGHGEVLMDWLVERASAAGCKSLQLDSGVQRFEAHRFYFREGMYISSYHFSIKLEGCVCTVRG